MKKLDELFKKQRELMEALDNIDPDTDEAVNIHAELDEISGKIDGLYSIDDYRKKCGPNGPTGHGDICWSDADPGL